MGKYSSSGHELVLRFCWVVEAVLSPAACSTWRRSAVRSSGPGTRSARGNARRRSARSRHSAVGCRCAPRPGAVPRGSGRTAIVWPSAIATTRRRSDLVTRRRHPTQVRTGTDLARLCGGVRDIEQPTFARVYPQPAFHRASYPPTLSAETPTFRRFSRRVAAFLASRSPAHRDLPAAWCPTGRCHRVGVKTQERALRPRCLVGCRCATRSAWQPALHSGLPCRWQGTAGSRER
jgi:hypothetical protein